jgi:hypothetical protein
MLKPIVLLSDESLAMVFPISTATSRQVGIPVCSQGKEGRDERKAKKREQDDGEESTQWFNST